ncbi:hypothetical protein I5L34_02705 [Pseudomonas aeruginosa]|uniref:hypothetical protein n=1 Tax=Pseudomonas aeruginosa TaxID=287 RepID=UPI00106863D8|nr:hypothetical protein [Pseudomonas aeruginosa]MBG4299329.1 hypothetical protein [Pseudomonas aeruginosa]MBH9455409.1 hypothetical protein [Pseudomonas aeruginosa]MBH9462194.1 hypothetical protein [Pseudomonas aeruginosa]MDI4100807.1 hypothetical protein [Pseudomonas aeruginosa]QPZ58009.1 hypothetical protein I9X26_24265 [Pseudomonas aeruginosa]
MNDRTLLELAARAAGMNIQRSRLDDPLHRDFLMNGEGVRNPGQCSFPWNPRDDDGDALRLAVRLNMDIRYESYDSGVAVIVGGAWDGAPEAVHEIFERDGPRATRRAIVRAAAEIGKSMGVGE